MNRETYVNHIMGGRSDSGDMTKTYYSVFGLLVYLEHPLFIIGFLDRNCSDHFLESWVRHTALFSWQNLKQYTGDYSNDMVRFERFARRFTASLPRFAVPHMESERFSQYHPSVVLPFVGEEEIEKRRDDDGQLTSGSANGKVVAFKIYREYNKFTVSIYYFSCKFNS
jgi:hypothetical protein